MSYLTRSSSSLVITAVALLTLTASPVKAELIIGLTTDNVLFSFDSATPLSVTPLSTVTGITGDLIGIDFRPSNGLLYGVTTTNNLYTINPSTGAASAPVVLVADSGDLTNPFTGLAGDFYGFDFNPFADRLRIVSGNGQNLRINPDTGSVITDTTLNGAVGTAEFAAYSNNVPNATETTLFVIDSNTDSLYRQDPPNDGTTTLIGALGAEVLANGGFDISGATGIAYLGVNNGNTDPAFHTINLTTGAQTLVSGIGISTGSDIRDLSVSIEAGVAAAPEPGALLLLMPTLAVAARIRTGRRK